MPLGLFLSSPRRRGSSGVVLLSWGLAEHWLLGWLVGLAGGVCWRLAPVTASGHSEACVPGQLSSAHREEHRNGRAAGSWQAPCPAPADSRQLLAMVFYKHAAMHFVIPIFLADLMFEVREEVENTYCCRNVESSTWGVNTVTGV